MAWEPDYCTVAELKRYARIPSDNTDDDVEIALDVTAASRAVDEFCGPMRQFGTVAAQLRTYEARPVRRSGRGYVWRADIDDLTTVSGLVVEVDGEAVTSDDYTLYPLNALAEGRAYEWVDLAGYATEVEITAAWGWSAVPTPVKRATMMQGNRFRIRRGSPFGIAGSPEQGSELRLLAKIDPDVSVILRKYRRIGSVG